MSDALGAELSEQLLEACRRDNTELLTQVLSQGVTAEFLNSTKDAIGNSAVLLACKAGAIDSLDILLDQDDVEIDSTNLLDHDTPLHVTVRSFREQPELAMAVLKLLLEAGADPFVKNYNQQRPLDLVEASQIEMRTTLVKAEVSWQLAKEQDDAEENSSGSQSQSSSEVG